MMKTHLCTLHYRLPRGLDVCDVIFEGGPGKCDEVWRRGEEVNFSLKSRDVIYGRPLNHLLIETPVYLTVSCFTSLTGADADHPGANLTQNSRDIKTRACSQLTKAPQQYLAFEIRLKTANSRPVTHDKHILAKDTLIRRLTIWSTTLTTHKFNNILWATAAKKKQQKSMRW